VFVPWALRNSIAIVREVCYVFANDHYRGVVMVTAGLLVRIEAKPGKVAEVQALLNSVLTRVREEPGTVAWFGLRLGPTTFGVFDAFPDDAGRQAHLAANAEALQAQAPELFAGQPSIEYADVLAAKLP